MRWVGLLLLLLAVTIPALTLGLWQVVLSSLGTVGFLLSANGLGLLPGTRLYTRRCELKEAEWALEKDRVERTRSRMRMLESAELDKTLALPPAKEDRT